ncbi:MAG: SDR family NAD(P)-dependent oxidoreductase [Gammaproteobacteria bacterium]
MEKRSILITGCSSGIGYCAAQRLQKAGYQVIASARKQSDVETLCKQGFDCIHLDLDDSISIEKGVNETLSRTDGKLYGLFNNAGYGQPGAVEDLRRDVLRKQFETNVFGSIELTNRVIPVMRQQGYGRIIQNSSVLGFVSLAYRGAYNASKYALEGLYDTLRLELANTDIHPILIEPGPITSKFRENAFAAYQLNIDSKNSAHAKQYLQTEQRLEKQGAVVPFTLPADAVVDKVIQALEQARPRPRYYVTKPTWIFGILKRILSTRAMDSVLLRISNKEQQ